LITKNTDPFKLKKCISCKKEILLHDRYFSYPLSLQSFCIECAKVEIPKTIETLNNDLRKIFEKI